MLDPEHFPELAALTGQNLRYSDGSLPDGYAQKAVLSWARYEREEDAMSEETAPIESPTRVCRKCSTQSTVPGDYCPSCGKAFVRGKRRRLSKKAVISAAVAFILVAATAGGFLIKHQHDQDTEEARIAAVQASEEAAAAEEASAAEAADDAERTKRAEWVNDLEGYVKKAAKKHVREGILDGPILSGSCTATGGGSTDDLTALTGTFACMAVNKENKDGTMSGYSYAGTIDWQTGEFTWQLGG